MYPQWRFGRTQTTGSCSFPCWWSPRNVRRSDRCTLCFVAPYNCSVLERLIEQKYRNIFDWKKKKKEKTEEISFYNENDIYEVNDI
ncbi:hypothetical protein HZH68_011928 [Vespula germanica]|uniref:Uncharacterized protein n=1 Tax=Vespula germanica TaxID=30212 RepID=A0A834JM69_VESGE|nr:hypothetical protein HZH68_011928 [Vespula germanica]